MGCCSNKQAVSSPASSSGSDKAPEIVSTEPAPVAEPRAAPPAPLAFYEDTRDQYRLKDITFFGSPRRILLQSANGPCPLLALCNVLLLRNQMRISQDSRYTSFTELVQEVGNVLFDVNARATADGAVERDDSGVLNVRESANACLEVLPKLNAGLDVNCKFGGPSQFEYTQELGVFDLLDIGLYHGWVVGEEDERAHAAIAHLSYNQIVEKLIAYQEQANMPANEQSSPEAMEEGALIADFLDRTASQLSQEGLAQLQKAISERQLVIFYRNGHFSTMVRYEGFQVSTAGSEEAGAYAAAMAAQEQVYAQDLVAGAFMGSSGEPPDADMLLALQLSQEDQAATTTATAQAGGATGLSEDELLAIRLMEEQVQESEQAQAQSQAGAHPAGAQV